MKGRVLPSISIIIPLYNVESYIEECLKSLLQQDFGDFEAICVDDGSTDNTLSVARSVVAGDERFTFIEQSNAGQSAARNRGLGQATGEYVLFLDSDDYYTTDALGKLIGRAQTDDLDMLFFSAKTFYENRELRRKNNEPNDNRESREGVFTGPELYVFFEESGAFRPSAAMFMVKRSLIEDASIRFYEGIIHEDLLFTMRAIVVARRAAFLNEVLYMRRMREGSTMTGGRGIRNVDGLFRVGRTMETWLSAHADEFDERFCDAYCSRIFYCWDIIAHDAISIDASELDDYADKLDRPDRISFDINVRAHADELDRIYRRLYESKTFKVGDFFMRVPRWLKSRIVMPS